MRRGALFAIFVLLTGALSACMQSGPDVIDTPAAAPVIVRPAEAADLLSGIRAEEGLPRVVVSPTLNAIAEAYADRLAAADEVRHDLGSTLAERLAAGGYLWIEAGENLGGGYRSLEEAFERWYDSAAHRRTMVAPGVTEIGIATAFNAASPYRNFWVLLVARPEGPI